MKYMGIDIKEDPFCPEWEIFLINNKTISGEMEKFIVKHPDRIVTDKEYKRLLTKAIRATKKQHGKINL